MSPAVDSVASNKHLPDRADVVVIGAGIIGVSAAYFLAKRGVSVALVEKGRVAGEQSSRNWGWCRQQGRDEKEIPLARESVRLWEELQHDIGTDLGFRRTGVLFATEDEGELARWERWANTAKRYDVATSVLTPSQTMDMTPGCTRRWVGSIHTPSDGRAEPAVAVPAIARAAQERGATIHQSCAARGIEMQAGRVSAVVTERGSIRTERVLCAAGAWSSMFCRRHDIDLPQLVVRGSVIRTEPLPSVTEGAVASSAFCIRRRLDGGYTLALRQHNTLDLTPAAFRYLFAFLPAYRQEGDHMKLRLNGRFFQALRWPRKWALDQRSPFEDVRVLDPEPDRKVLTMALSNLRKAFPSLSGATTAESWAGMIDVTPDAVPVISSVDDLPGLTLATGFSGHGFGIGPGAGHLAADLVNADLPIVAPDGFGYERMIDGTKLIPEAV